MLIANVTYTTFNQRLLNEAPLLLCTALAYIAARRASRGTGIGVCVAAGVLAGLAIVAKHTGVLTVAAAVGLVGLADLAKRLRMRLRHCARRYAGLCRRIRCYRTEPLRMDKSADSHWRCDCGAGRGDE